IWIDAIHFAGDNQALKNAYVFGADLCPAKQPILTAQWQDSQRVFRAFWFLGFMRVHRKDTNGVSVRQWQALRRFAVVAVYMKYTTVNLPRSKNDGTNA
ncbi:MAG: hypothetical protein JXR76_11295, partial [Deltaproteobacteria bacterium]|nr:hypothetical protein [Deltaproteobacteria bacterium]